MVIHPWNDWYHCTCHTYGTWLPGDPKGFRTRHHREHIEGDHENPPPPGKYEKRHRYAKSLMTRDPVYLNKRQQERALEEIVISLLRNDVPVQVASLDTIHLHVLAQVIDHDPRKWVGIAKRESSHYLKCVNLAPVGGLWGTRTQCKPVHSAVHFDNSDGYIFDHRLQGAVAWHRSHC